MLLAALLPLLNLCFHYAKSLPPICDHSTRWTVGERDIVHESRGFILLAVFMPLQGSSNIHTQLMKLQAIGETIREVRVVVIAPQNEDSRLLDRYRAQFPQVTFEMESANEPAWAALGASAYDHFIYDRCGRIANVIRHPRSDIARFEDTVNSLKGAINYAHCGWCNYNLRTAPTPALIAPEMHKRRARETESSEKCESISHLLVNELQITAYLLPSTKGAAERGSVVSTTNQMTSSRMSGAQYPHSQPQFMSSQDRLSTAEHRRGDVKPTPSQRTRGSSQRSRFDTATSSGRSSSTQSGQVPDRKQGIWRPSSEFAERKRQQYSKKDQEGGSNDAADNRNQEMSRSQAEVTRNRQHYGEVDHDRRTQELQKKQHEEQKREQERRQREEQRRRDEYDRQQREYQRRNEEREEHQKRLSQQQQRQYSSLQPLRQQVGREQQSAQDPFDAAVQKSSMSDNTWEEDYDSGWTPTPDPVTISESSLDATSEHISPPLYGPDEDDEYIDYGDPNFGISTKAPFRTQIPPTPPPTVGPTLISFIDSVPCAAFTDDVCYQQIKKSGKQNMNKCCNKGVYLSDVCVPGRCSNVTTRICCIQKFMQAKYLCCENNNSSFSGPGDAFSRCCYEHFVREADTCCPMPLAKYHWLSTSELCLPNVRVDLSGVRIVVELGDSKKVNVDLGEDRSWDHKCQHSDSAPQFIYIPDDDSTDSEEKRFVDYNAAGTPFP
ncbi:Reticulocyte-binding protein 2 -like protein a [Toxocara canis]|uniref:Reticulocyte-binding protein 2-like protein a n=1 Tax=Toxocara canis TaxID=6265 RepID=A0A0B2VN39_TOXCA|nr:Reticulocyte-binding protein 2 -like protein a [Toxocara canis]